MSADLCSKMFSLRVRVVGCFLDSPEEAVGWMESLCRAFPTNPKEAEAALTELRRSEHAVEVSKIILGGWRRGALRAGRGDLFRRYMLARSGFVPGSDTQDWHAATFADLNQEIRGCLSDHAGESTILQRPSL